MTKPSSWDGEAFNEATSSENEIHGDDVARRYGFAGGLVPGVAVAAYVVHPALVAWGDRWLTRGRATVESRRPLYDRGAFRVDVTSGPDAAYHASLVDHEGTECAVGRVVLETGTRMPPERRGDPAVCAIADRPNATRDQMELLRDRGMGAVRVRWDEKAEIRSYLRDPASMPASVRYGESGVANPAFLFALTNWALARNVCLGPWLHLEIDARSFAPVPWASELVVESSIADLFDRKGHEFADLDCHVFFSTGEAVMAARMRCIYRLRLERGAPSPPTRPREALS